MRQKTFLMTRGMFLCGEAVSPAVMAMDSVPPSGWSVRGFNGGSGDAKDGNQKSGRMGRETYRQRMQ